MWFNFRYFNEALSQCDLPPTLYSIMESMVNYDNTDPVKIRDLSLYAREKIFDFNYPISEAFNKEKFEDLFLKHYMFRRINYDTFTSFKIHLEVKLNEIMPKYNKMLDGFNMLNFLGETETHLRNVVDSRTTASNGTSDINNTSSDNSETINKYSDTPQDLISDILNDEYVTEFTQNKNNSTGNSSSHGVNTNNTNDNGNLEENITIHRGDSIDEYKKYLEVVDNIYSLIFKECDSLFYGLV